MQLEAAEKDFQEKNEMKVWLDCSGCVVESAERNQ